MCSFYFKSTFPDCCCFSRPDPTSPNPKVLLCCVCDDLCDLVLQNEADSHHCGPLFFCFLRIQPYFLTVAANLAVRHFHFNWAAGRWRPPPPPPPLTPRDSFTLSWGTGNGNEAPECDQTQKQTLGFDRSSSMKDTVLSWVPPVPVPPPNGEKILIRDDIDHDLFVAEDDNQAELTYFRSQRQCIWNIAR